ncbi:hypothetical protein HID58_042548 [Brassica napus]|uniref:RNA-dependent RNA polymerase n=1 Tax=Brassica napus TaxID=3708 RepID=A0ABQ8BE24_BRANA|nr:hypothetical protein HID58_042548 [Brassica napus]
MGSEGNMKNSVVTQVSIGGFGETTTAKELTDYLEEEVGLVWRCRLKTSWTPPGSYPDFEITDTSNIPTFDGYKRVEPHAFVHFAVPESAGRAMDAAGQSKLILDGQPLKVSLGPKNPYTLNQRRRTTTPYKLTGVSIEIGTLIARDEFLVSWRAEGVDFLVDPFDNTCRFCFTKSTAFSLKDTMMYAVINCDYKLELLLASSPRVWYRTADDDIYETVPVDLLDDDDPWIRTTDFTQAGAIGRCLSYRVLISPRYEKKMNTALDYLRARRVQEERVRWPPRIRDEPCFGEPITDHFFCIHHREGISFEIMFLVNAVLHRGVFNQFHLTERFFDLLRNQPKDINIASLKHLCTYKRPVFDAYKRLKLETKTDLQVVTGYVAIAKNPCLHPGDVRILEAVDVPELHHMYDCLLFPQKGERPHTNEASGSDLDGDLYFVAWDQRLIPPSRTSFPAMQYTAAEESSKGRPVNHQDIIEFFVKNMANEHLGTICNAHVVHADRSEYGAMDEECLLLAELAATAVDFPKTGKLVTMPFHLKPKLYPDFMGKEEYQTYRSKKILGRLYRRVKEVYDEDAEASSEENSDPGDIPYDTDLEVPGFEDFVPEAWGHKCSYDGQLIGLLGQYKVQKEEEIVTGHIWSMPKYTSSKQGELKERLKHSYNSLKKELRKVFEETKPEHESLSEEEKNVMYEKKASAWYHVTYHPEWVKKSTELQEPGESSGHAVMLSFAWIAADYLARIKVRSGEMGMKMDSAKPVDALAKYLSQRL